MRLNTLITLLLSILPSISALQSSYPRPWTPNDPCPTSIKATIVADPCRSDVCNPDRFAFTTLDSVHSALITCPNISSLDLGIHGSCSTWPDRRNLPLSPLGGEKYPNIRTLKVEGYEWDRWHDHDTWTGPKCLAPGKLECFMDTLYWFYQGHWMSWLKWRTQPKEQRDKTNAELWLDAMDWTKIEELSVDRVPPSVQKILSQSHSLRKLNTTDIRLIYSLRENTLTHFSYVNGEYSYADLHELMLDQCESLKSLEIRWNGAHLPMRYAYQLDNDITNVAHCTKRLNHLSMNVLQNVTTSPLSTLEKIASIPTLREADLWFEIRDGPQGQWGLDVTKFSDRDEWAENATAPLLDGKSALRLFQYMREKKQGKELERTNFWVGDWSPDWCEDSERVKVECEAKADVDMEDWCVVEDEWRGSIQWRGSDVSLESSLESSDLQVVL
jgi:hypothetical protein